MSFLRTLTLTVCVLSTASVILMMLVPDRYRRELRSVLSLITLVTIGASLLGADFSDLPGFNGLSFDASLSDQDSLIQSQLEARLSEYVSSLLREEGIICKKVEVRTTIDDARSIFISKASLWLDPADSIRQDEISAKIREKTGDIEVEITYEDS